MAIFNFYLDLDKEYILLIKDIYKVLVILIVFQIILYFSNCQKNIINSALTGNILNDEFITLLIYIIISIVSYYLLFNRLISIN
jgi:hypothetical protein